jgi:SnoaL-like domain
VTDDRAIRDLLACYALALDTDDIDRCVDVFIDDGEFVVFRRRRCRFITSGGPGDRPEVPSS